MQAGNECVGECDAHRVRNARSLHLPWRGQRSAASVPLHVAVDNIATISLYKRLGFAAVRKLAAYVATWMLGRWSAACCSGSGCRALER